MLTTTSPEDAARTEQLNQLLIPILPIAYRVALSLTRNGADAEDVVQDAAVNACRGFAGFEPGTNFKAWFLRIVTNAFISRYRRHARAGSTVGIDDLDPADEHTLHTADGHQLESDALGQCVSQMETEEILSALATLPLEYRTVAILYFVDDQSYQDIAAAVGCPVGTVRSRLHRSRAHLKRALRHLADERGFPATAAALAEVA